MTKKQFNGFIRFVLDALESAKEERDAKEREEKYDRVMQHLRDLLED